VKIDTIVSFALIWPLSRLARLGRNSQTVMCQTGTEWRVNSSCNVGIAFAGKRTRISSTTTPHTYWRGQNDGLVLRKQDFERPGSDEFSKNSPKFSRLPAEHISFQRRKIRRNKPRIALVEQRAFDLRGLERTTGHVHPRYPVWTVNRIHGGMAARNLLALLQAVPGTGKKLMA
jgi:hypothetical protein